MTVGAPRNDGAIEISGPALRNGDQIIVAGANLSWEGQKVQLISGKE